MSVVHLPHSFNERNRDARAAKAKVPQRLRDEALHNPADRFLTHTGKRIRAAIVNGSFCAAGGGGVAPRQIAEAIELLHAGSLIVDDIEDNSTMRRGRPTLHREVGMPVALNIGNWMYFRSLEKLSCAGLPRKTVHAMLSRSVRTIRRCHEGQALDLAASVDTLEPDEIYPTARSISRLKTGGLTALASWLGAIAADADVLKRRALGRFGMAVGVCLQMHNDLDELRHLVEGQPRFDDLRNAQVTWAWAWATKAASKPEIVSLQYRLRHASGNLDEMKWIARRLLELVGDRGAALIKAKLERELTLLGEHVESTQSLRLALRKIQGTR